MMIMSRWSLPLELFSLAQCGTLEKDFDFLTAIENLENLAE